MFQLILWPQTAWPDTLPRACSLAFFECFVQYKEIYIAGTDV